MCRIILISVFSLILVNGLQEGDNCNANGVTGKCIVFDKCTSAMESFSKQIYPEMCTVDAMGNMIVCCTKGEAATTTTTTTTTTRPRLDILDRALSLSDEDDYSTEDEGCEPVAANLTTSRTGQKAWDKCIEYQEQLVYPCEKSASFGSGMVRGKHCNHLADELIVGGVDAKEMEFPHMALLGYGSDPQDIRYKCGGSIISDRFILTAGHCISDNSGNVSYVAVGRLRRSEPYNSTRVHKVARIFKHPNYDPPYKHDDIALLETETPINLDVFTVPACLHVGNLINDSKALAAGWGLTRYLGREADILQKVELTKFTTPECMYTYRGVRLMRPGYNERTQLCYGHHDKSKDACQGDSGGPLQIKNNQIHCMYTVIGITSFGKGCGSVGEPGIYTRVSAYVPWIEGIVWP